MTYSKERLMYWDKGVDQYAVRVQPPVVAGEMREARSEAERWRDEIYPSDPTDHPVQTEVLLTSVTFYFEGPIHGWQKHRGTTGVFGETKPPLFETKGAGHDA